MEQQQSYSYTIIYIYLQAVTSELADLPRDEYNYFAMFYQVPQMLAFNQDQFLLADNKPIKTDILQTKQKRNRAGIKSPSFERSSAFFSMEYEN